MPLDGVRQEIEEIDDKIIDCIMQRMKLAEKVFEIKSKENIPIEDKEQNNRVLDRAAEKASKLDLDSESVRAIFEILLKMSIKRQDQLKLKK